MKKIRPLTLKEHEMVIDYFLHADTIYLQQMGVDKSKLLEKLKWKEMLWNDFRKEKSCRKFYYVGWEYDGALIGHSNINNIIYGETANIHLHVWDGQRRKKGLGFWYFKNSINHFFGEYKLKKIICEPYSKNQAPNKVLQKLGLWPTERYETVPGPINFKQFVNRYEITEPIF